MLKGLRSKTLRKRDSKDVKTLKYNDRSEEERTILELRDTLELPATAPPN